MSRIDQIIDILRTMPGGMTTAEVAEQIGMRKDTVSSILSKAVYSRGVRKRFTTFRVPVPSWEGRHGGATGILRVALWNAPSDDEPPR